MVACCGSGSVVGKGGQPHDDDDDDDHDDHYDDDGDDDGEDVYPKSICMRLRRSGSSPPLYTQQANITNQPQ